MLLSNRTKKKCRFVIRDMADVQAMQKTLYHDAVSTESVYIACELAANIIKAEEHGEIEIIDENEVVSDFSTRDFRYVKSKIFKAKRKVEWIKSGHTIQVSATQHQSGYGFISIIYAGWELEAIQPFDNSICRIRAIRRGASNYITRS